MGKGRNRRQPGAAVARAGVHSSYQRASARVRAGLLGAVLAGVLAAPGARAAAPDLATCESRANDMPALLAECIQTPWIWRHLLHFQAIADANPDSAGHGNRDAGTPGYFKSVAYVAARLRAAGYAVQIQPYRFHYQAASFTPALHALGRDWRHGAAWFAAIGSAGGHVRARVQGLGADQAGDGCSMADFAGFVPGRVALIPQGACGSARPVRNAQAAGAAAVILYRHGAAGLAAAAPRPARLGQAAGIPVAGLASEALGQGLRARLLAGHAEEVALDLATTTVTVDDQNLIADSPQGDAAHVVVVDAHLDSIYGPGILDNASGAASILEIALKLAHTPTRNRLRFAFFGGEELGLHGSQFYTRTLSAAARAALAYDVDVDVTATPNYDVLIADAGHAANQAKFPPGTVAASQRGNQIFSGVLAAAGIAARYAGFGNDGTDSNSFALIGVPDTGILTQQDCCKGAGEVHVWGGFPGNYEGVVPGHNGGCVDNPDRWCDTIANVNGFVLGFATMAAAQTVLSLAQQDLSAPPPARR